MAKYLWDYLSLPTKIKAKACHRENDLFGLELSLFSKYIAIFFRLLEQDQ